MLGFTQLVLCDVEGEGICTDASTHNFSGLPGFEASAAGERGVSFLENQRILYTVPIVYEGSIFGVLAGERDKANMQALIATDGFDGNSVSCIIDRDSNVVISPTNLDFFFALDDLFVANKDPELASAVREMQANMQANVSGVIVFTTPDGVDVIMSYDPLETCDWVLLTILPADIISIVWGIAEQEYSILVNGSQGLSAFSISDVSWTFDKEPRASWMETLSHYMRW